MRRRVILGLGLAATLGGCAAPAMMAEQPEPAWRPSSGDRVARLTLDAGRLTLTCQPRAGAVEIDVVGGPQAGAVLDIHSGRIWNRYPGAGHGERGGPMTVQVRLSAADPVLQAFADTGELAVVFDGGRLTAPRDFAQAHNFMAVCRLP